MESIEERFEYVKEEIKKIGIVLKATQEERDELKAENKSLKDGMDLIHKILNDKLKSP